MANRRRLPRPARRGPSACPVASTGVATHATINLRLAQGPRDLKARAPRPQNDTGEQEEVDQLTAFRTGAFDSLDARNSSAP